MALPFRIIRRFSKKALIITVFLIIILLISRFYVNLNAEIGSVPWLRPTFRPTLGVAPVSPGQPNKIAAEKDKDGVTKSKTESRKADLAQTVAVDKNDNQQDNLNKITKKEDSIKTVDVEISPCPNVHIFYYPWYNNPKIDQHYAHWNHAVLPHWDKNTDKLYEKKPHNPPNDIGSNFYPELGAYSSRDPEVIRDHLRQISGAGIGVIVVSYYPLGVADDNGKPWDDIYIMLLDQAAGFNLKVTFHIEPYKNRDEKTVRDDVVHIVDTYGSHEGFYKHKYKDNAFVPLIYVYDSYHTKPEDWARILSPEGPNTIRGTKYDVLMIALAVELAHTRYVTVGGFNGLYTYFATNGFTYGSSWPNWEGLSKLSLASNSLFIPSVGPGYIDTSIRPWNGENTRERLGGEYYRNSWNSALESAPEIVSITSFNEWHEGTQIEKAIPKVTNSRLYLDYMPFPPNHYLDMTRRFIEKFSKCEKPSTD